MDNTGNSAESSEPLEALPFLALTSTVMIIFECFFRGDFRYDLKMNITRTVDYTLYSM
jgi:hypothetical protein